MPKTEKIDFSLRDMPQTGCPFDFNDDQILSNQDRNRAVLVEYIVQKCKLFNYFLSSATTWKDA